MKQILVTSKHVLLIFLFSITQLIAQAQISLSGKITEAKKLAELHIILKVNNPSYSGALKAGSLYMD